MSALSSGSPAWTSRFAFLMASIGFAVGLGNIWRFPYVTGENGGGAFILIYLLCVVLIGIPILMAELTIGRRGGMTPPGSMQKVAVQEGASRHWRSVGWMNLLTAFLIMVTYSVDAGWVFYYLYLALTSGFAGVDPISANQAFDDLLESPIDLLFWTYLSLIITGTIIYAGIEKGIERAVTILMPLLFVLMMILVVYNIINGGFVEAAAYLFIPDFSRIDGNVMLAALGQAFFSIGVAMAGMMTFGAYLPKDVSITTSAFQIIIADTFIALLAGLVIFPAVFVNGLDPAGGPGLIFQTLPVAFADMPGGHLVSVTFFLLLAVAAITSMVGLVEPLVRWLEEKAGYSRHLSATLIISAIGSLSLVSCLGYNLLSHLSLFDRDINGLTDYVSNQILLPLGGLLIAVFAGWFVSRKTLLSELDIRDNFMFKSWLISIRYLVPPAVLIVFILGIT